MSDSDDDAFQPVCKKRPAAAVSAARAKAASTGASTHPPHGRAKQPRPATSSAIPSRAPPARPRPPAAPVAAAPTARAAVPAPAGFKDSVTAAKLGPSGGAAANINFQTFKSAPPPPPPLPLQPPPPPMVAPLQHSNSPTVATAAAVPKENRPPPPNSQRRRAPTATAAGKGAHGGSGGGGGGEMACPICARLLADVADTMRAQEAHVNDCLETSAAAAASATAAAGRWQQEFQEGDRPPCAVTTDHPVPVASAASQTLVRAAAAVADVEAVAAPLRAGLPAAVAEAVAEWLDRLGCRRYAARFFEEEVGLEALPLLMHSDLAQLGVSDAADAAAILAAARRLPTVDYTSLLGLAAPPGLVRERPGGEEGGTSDNIVAAAAAAAATESARARSALEHDLAVQSEASTSGRAGGMAPEWVLVQGTPGFTVDGVAALTGAAALHCRSWFLSRFPAEHTSSGLTKEFARGALYCTVVTARLMQAVVGLPPHRLRPLPLRQPSVVEGVTVTLLDANHCPGAAMVLFEPGSGTPVLHTGAFRYTPQMCQCPALQRVRGRAVLVLDTTHCRSDCVFPARSEAVRFALAAFKAETFNPATLFLVGTHILGMEQLFLGLARALGQKVYVGKAKRKVLDCLELTPEDRALLTDDANDSQIHVVPMAQVSFASMARILQHYRKRFNTIVAFRPSACAETTKQVVSAVSVKGRRAKGSLVLYDLPYSEHSSFNELKAFVQWFRPTRIVPSVHNDRGPLRDRMVQLLMAP